MFIVGRVEADMTRDLVGVQAPWKRVHLANLSTHLFEGRGGDQCSSKAQLPFQERVSPEKAPLSSR